jgi:hypothetical protein
VLLELGQGGGCQQALHLTRPVVLALGQEVLQAGRRGKGNEKSAGSRRDNNAHPLRHAGLPVPAPTPPPEPTFARCEGTSKTAPLPSAVSVMRLHSLRVSSSWMCLRR